MEVINAEFNDLLPASTGLDKHNDDFLQEHHETAPHVQACLKVRQMLDPSTSEKVQQDLIRTLALENCSLKDAVRGLEILEEWKPEPKYKDDYIAAAHERWPEASAFASKKD